MSTATATNPVYAAAIQYRLSGLQVIPIRADSTKAPALEEWKPYQDPAAQVDLSVFSRHVGVGVVCGRASGNLEVIDFDDPSLYAGWCELVEERVPGIIQRLTIIQTPRQNEAGQYGKHVYYRCAKPDGNTKLARYVTTEGKAKASIETRGEGGYVVAPGSPAKCHETGRCYEVLAGAGRPADTHDAGA